MPESEKNLHDTLSEVVGETTETTTSKVEETQEDISSGSSDETKSGDTADKNFVSGIDISDVPEELRSQVQKYLFQKANLLEKGYQGKFQEVARFKKAQEEIVQSGISVDEARDVLNKHIQSKRNPVTDTQKEKTLKTLDKLIEQSPYEQRPALEQMRQIVLEEADTDKLRTEIANLKTIVNELAGEGLSSKQAKVNNYLEGVSEKYGKDLIDKYRGNFIDAHIRYKIPMERLITAVIPLEELEQAITSKVKSGKTLTKEKKEAISSPGSGVTSAREQIDVKKISMRDLLMGAIGERK